MTINILTRQSMVRDQQVHEPTLLAMALTVTGFAILLGPCIGSGIRDSPGMPAKSRQIVPRGHLS